MCGTVAFGRPDMNTPLAKALIEKLGYRVLDVERADENLPADVALIVLSATPAQDRPNVDSGSSTLMHTDFLGVIRKIRKVYPDTPIALIVSGASTGTLAWIETFTKFHFSDQEVCVLAVEQSSLDNPALGRPYTFVIVGGKDIDPKQGARESRDLAGAILQRHAREVQEEDT